MNEGPKEGEIGFLDLVQDCEALDVDASSSLIRKALQDPGDDSEEILQRLLPPNVLAYIREHHLFVRPPSKMYV